MSTLIIGSNGSMGRRYQSVLKYLGVNFFISDIDTNKQEMDRLINRCRNIIVATPTDTHHKILLNLLDLDKNILCEKPITKNMEELRDIIDKIKQSRSVFTMAMQYKNLIKKKTIGTSHYNYFRTGKDGLIWDCLQIIGLSDGLLVLEDTSPIWRCKINGTVLNISDMDKAYVDMTYDFLNKVISDDLEFLLKIHLKASLMKSIESTNAQ